MKPLVSAIIPNYNYSRYICEAVESALNQTYKNVEVIVVDDGSSDDSLKVLSGYGDRIKVISQKNAGVAMARNNGVEVSTGEYVAFLDADDVWLPDKVEKQVDRFLAEPALGLVHVGVQDISAEGNDLDVHTDGMQGKVSHELLLFDRPVILGGGSGIMVPRNVFDEVGGFDTRLSTSADWDLFYQISSRYEVGFVSDVLLRYRFHGSNMHGNIDRMQREMIVGFDKAFEGSLAPQNIKRDAYANLYRTLSGSYFYTGNYKQFGVFAAKSVLKRPGNFLYFAKFPIRRMRKIRS